MNQFAQTRDEVALIEDWHRTMLQLIEKINCCREFELPENFKILVFALEQIFGNEQRLMEKSNFPAIKCHLEQHARVLGALHHVHSSVMRGDIGLARRVGSQLLFDWFNLHSNTLDQALSVWIACNKNSILTQLLDYQTRNKRKILSTNSRTPILNKLYRTDYSIHS